MGQETMENSENRNKPASPVNVMVSDNYIFQDELQRRRHMDYNFSLKIWYLSADFLNRQKAKNELRTLTCIET